LGVGERNVNRPEALGFLGSFLDGEVGEERYDRKL
jgi:hypothetical protein